MRTFRDMYFRVESPEHSMRIQRELTSLGYKWEFKGGDEPSKDMAEKVKEDGSIFIRTTVSGTIYRSKDSSYVANIPEYKLDAAGYVTSVSGAETSPYTHDHTVDATKWNVSSTPAQLDIPPLLGLKPRALHDGQRRKDLLAAMTRYSDYGVEIPQEWLVELVYVNKGSQTKIVIS